MKDSRRFEARGGCRGVVLFSVRYLPLLFLFSYFFLSYRLRSLFASSIYPIDRESVGDQISFRILFVLFRRVVFAVDPFFMNVESLLLRRFLPYSFRTVPLCRLRC